MPATSPSNYPDLLGYVTGGARYNLGVVQAALAVRPQLLHAGRPFEVILLMQNASDSSVDVSVTLQLPKNFVAAKAKLLVGLAAAEVGYVVLPMTALADTPPNPAVKLTVEMDAKPLTAKPNRIRPAEGDPTPPTRLLPEAQNALDTLKNLRFSVDKGRGRAAIEKTVALMGASRVSAQLPNLNPGWVSLWTLERQDKGLLLHRYAALLKSQTLRQLRHNVLLKPLVQATEARFRDAGYPLDPSEAVVIGKLMTLVLEYAEPTRTAHGARAAGRFNLLPYIEKGLDIGENDLPHWIRAMLGAIARDERAAQYPVQVVTKLAYDDLLRDALDLAFEIVSTATGENLGTQDEMREYGDQVLERFRARQGLDFARVYMPLVIGGILVNDKFAAEDENLVENLRQLWNVLDRRKNETTDDTQFVTDMAEGIIERALETFGHRRSSL